MKNLKMKAARAGKDLSQQELADLVGVSRQTISAIEKGNYNPTINLCVNICKALDKTLDDLFWPDNQKKGEHNPSLCGVEIMFTFLINIQIIIPKGSSTRQFVHDQDQQKQLPIQRQ